MTAFRKLRASYYTAILLGLFKYHKFGNDADLLVKDAGAKGEGLFTKTFRKKGSLVFIATGPTVYARFEDSSIYDHPDWFSVDKDIWIDIKYPYIKINHSCNPNTGIDGSRCFVALRDILPGEELSFDYSMTDDEADWVMPYECSCGAEDCYKTIGSIYTVTEERYRKSYPLIPKYFKKLYEDKISKSSTGTQL